MRRVASERRALSEEEIARVEALRAEAERIEEEAAEADEFSDEADLRLGEIEAEIEAIHQRPAIYDPADIAMAGAFVSIDGSGRLRVERGYVRPEDEPPMVDAGGDALADGGGEDVQAAHYPSDDADRAMQESRVIVAHADDDAEPEEDEGIRPLPDRLLTELTAYRTLALREALGNEPGVAFLALLHALCLKLFYRYGAETCLEIEAKSVMFGAQAPGWPTRRWPSGWMRGIATGRRSCPRSLVSFGISWRVSIPTAGRPCSPIASR
jgi:ParB family transcriptional regulator, chromosome partitioning protein